MKQANTDYSVDDSTEATNDIAICPTNNKIKDDNTLAVLSPQDIISIFNNNEGLTYEIFTAVSCCEITKEVLSYITQYDDAIMYPDPRDKYLNRFAQIISKLTRSNITSISASNIFQQVDFIDTFTNRDHLYNIRLQNDSNFIFPTEINFQDPWEVVIMPIKRYFLNYKLLEAPFLGMVMQLYLLLLISIKTPSLLEDYSNIILEINDINNIDNIDGIIRKYFLHDIQQPKLNTKELNYV